MEDLKEALREWRDARQAFWVVKPVAQGERFPPEIWNRLANAEHKLMDLAREL